MSETTSEDVPDGSSEFCGWSLENNLYSESSHAPKSINLQRLEQKGKNMALGEFAQYKVKTIHSPAGTMEKITETAIKPTQEAWVSKMESKGLPGKELMNKWKELYKKWEKRYPEHAKKMGWK